MGRNIASHRDLAQDDLGECFQHVNAQSHYPRDVFVNEDTDALTFDASNGAFYHVVLNGDVAASSIINGEIGEVVILAIEQGTESGGTFVWPTGVKYAGGTAPTTSGTGGDVDVLTVIWDGNFWLEVARSVGDVVPA